MKLESILVSDESTMVDAGYSVAERDLREDDRQKQVTVDFKMVTFSLSGKEYAIDIMNVKEIAKAGHFTYVPNTLSFVVGVYNLRGEIIPILDMRIFFGIPVQEKNDSALENLLILSVEEQTFGIIVDKIDKVVGVQKSNIQPPHPLFSDINIKYISGVVESEKRLYILLDIHRIFTKGTTEAAKKVENVVVNDRRPQIEQPVQRAFVSKVEAGAESPSVSSEVKSSIEPSVPGTSSAGPDQNLQFVIENLKTFRNFNVSEINKAWVSKRFEEWKASRGSNCQLKSEADAMEFLGPYWSTSNDTWWTKEYADAVAKILPDNAAKQIVVWNPGCGKGYETYCLACVLTERYPDSKIKIYAQDVDLLSISNAPMLNVPDNMGDSWFAPFLSKTASGKLTFSGQIKDSIMFEYHDCQHTNALPVTDLIFARDILPFIDNDCLKNVLSDFEEKLKGNGLLIVGENEVIPGSSGFVENTVGMLTAYNKQ